MIQKKKILIFLTALLIVTNNAYATWSIDYDSAGSSRWSSDRSGGDFLFWDTSGYKFTNDNGSTYTYQQTGINDAYAWDSTPLPTMTYTNDEGLDWPCGNWSQYSQACTSTSTATSTTAIDLNGVIFGLGIIIVLMFVNFLAWVYNNFENKKFKVWHN